MHPGLTPPRAADSIKQTDVRLVRFRPLSALRRGLKRAGLLQSRRGALALLDRSRLASLIETAGD
jgi:hypothetical protein